MWSALREHLAATPVPPTAQEVEDLLLEAFLTVVRVDLRTATDEQVYRREFAHGGMSSGHVHLPTWREKLIPLLVNQPRTHRS